MRNAIVDIGSNTIRLIVFDVEENSRSFKKILNKVHSRSYYLCSWWWAFKKGNKKTYKNFI